VIRRVVEKAAHSVPVIAGTGSNSTAEAVEAARYADRLQARMRMRLADSRARLRIGDSLTYSMNRRLSGTKHRMQVLAARMEALSPLARLSGGYGFVTDSRGKGVFTVDTLREGDLLRVRLRDGSVRTRVEEIERTAPAKDHIQGETGQTAPAGTRTQRETGRTDPAKTHTQGETGRTDPAEIHIQEE
jgi:exonuclease VII large subunit